MLTSKGTIRSYIAGGPARLRLDAAGGIQEDYDKLYRPRGCQRIKSLGQMPTCLARP